MQRFGGQLAPLVVIDYAHTPDALEKALATLRPLADARSGKLWVVFGAGGDRDPGKRAPMGLAASQGADLVVITSDNPRSEDPERIVAEIERGVRSGTPHERLIDRAQAIAHAIERAAVEDVVLIAGKGHETYQDAGGVKRPFSDVDETRNALAARRAGNGTGPARSGSPASAMRSTC
jgi:UDP-N-acetylmuramoyl-L-alanyl-D-glutamate--2,6-diaminopimelate ligase